MSRLSKYLLLVTLIVFILACNTVTKPITDTKNFANTAESFASALPIETFQAFATNMPVSTLEAVASEMPDLTNMFNPQGEPVSEWNGIPIMSDATAGQELSSTSYSFATPSDPKAIEDFYNLKLKDLGWNSMFGSQVSDQGGFMLFQKGQSALTVTIGPSTSGSSDKVVNFQLVSQ
jgi:hypothetical protein